MKKMKPPELKAEDIYDDVTERSRKESKKVILERLKQHIFERYQEYEANYNSLESISESIIYLQEEKDALLSCYSRNKDGYLEGVVVTQIVEQQSVQHKHNCPYCGLDKPRTIDHYLPKSEFPEFSILPSNLIPCCGYCNSKKKERWIEDGRRIFVNFYYDDIPEEVQYLYPVLSYEDESSIGIQFTLERNELITDSVFDLLKSHYSYLNLLNEYSESVEEIISNIVCEIEEYPDVSIEEHKISLERNYRTTVRNYGLNHWKSVVLRALIDSDTFWIRSKVS